jgi:two-component system, NarL family, sensor histidine kinase DesK
MKRGSREPLGPWWLRPIDAARPVGARLTIDRWRTGRPFGRNRVLGLGIWAVFIVVPVINAIASKDSEPGHAFVIVAAVVFTSAYVLMVLICFEDRPAPLAYALSVLLLTIAVALTLADDGGWGFLFSYSAACVALVMPSRLGMPAVIGCGAIAAACALIHGGKTGGGGAAVGWGASSVGVGLLLVLMRDLRMSNRELTEARAELARAAVAAERERFARDLHDLLGHSLSVIAIKSELAGRLLPGSPERAAGEVADVEQVARQALREVRDAVSGYRRPTLDDELEGARVALSAAGIEASFDHTAVGLDPEVEAVLAWAVREGATNVIRHSGARRCEVRVRASDGDAAVEVLDDGTRGRAQSGPEAGAGAGAGAGVGVGLGLGCGAGAPLAGNGLAGLAERAERLSGQIAAGERPDGGFRLEVSVPLAVP